MEKTGSPASRRIQYGKQKDNQNDLRATVTASKGWAASHREGQAGSLLTGATIAIMITLYTRPQNVPGQVILVVGTLLAFVLLMRGLSHPRLLTIPWLFVAIAALSIFWSKDSSTVLTRTIALAVPLLLAGLIANSVPFERFLTIADRTFKTIVLASLFIGIVHPAVGLTQDALLHGTFRGIFVHRNLMGYIVVLAAITLLARNWGARGLRAGTIFWLSVYLLAFLWTGSAGAIALIVTSFALYSLARWVAKQRQTDRVPLLISALFLTIFVAVLALPYASTILELFDRDLTFTNRTYIWQGAIQAWEDHFWLGYGWGSILGADDEAANVIKRSAGWLVTSTHNGYLSTALQIGVVGLITSVAFLCVVLFSTLKQTIENPGPQAVWSLQVVAILIIGDATETRAFVNIGWFFLCLIAYYNSVSRSNEIKRPSDSASQETLKES